MKEAKRRVILRATEREKAFIEARFSSSGEKYFNDFFKDRVKQLKIYTVSDAPIDDLANELKKATDYINAMAKYSNQGGIISLEHLIESIENLQPYEKKLKGIKEEFSPLFAKYPSRRRDDYKKYEEIVFDGRQRTYEFRARFTLEEYEKLVEKKEKSGYVLMQHFLMKCMVDDQCFHFSYESFRRIRNLFSNAQNNMRQIARNENDEFEVRWDDILKVQNVLTASWERTRDLQQKLALIMRGSEKKERGEFYLGSYKN